MSIYKELIYLSSFILILILFRLIPHPPNFSPIIAASLIGPYFLKSRIFTIFIIISSMFISDIFLGFHIYQIVIYLTLISISIFAIYFNQKKYLLMYSLFASIWFFLVTNFAVWIYWDFYPKNFEGLLLCYYLALPFFTNTLISTLFFTLISLFFLKPLKIIPNKILQIIKI